MQTVGIGEGIAYGFRIMLYYIGVILGGNIISGLGVAMMFSGFERGVGLLRTEPNWALIISGGAVALLGLLTVLAGIFGAIYKVIADSVAKGNVITPD
jgi:hypothetical protein